MKKKVIGISFICFFLCLSWLGFSHSSFALPLVKESFFLSDEEVIRLSTGDLLQPYFVEINYPVTNYPELDQRIEEEIQKYVTEFERTLSSPAVQPNQAYSLLISYETYHYQSYLSYQFSVFMDTGGAHPNHFLWTIVFDQEKEEIFLLTDWLKCQPNLLEFLSHYSRQELIQKEGIVNTSMMIEGTKPTIENFSHFVFDTQGVIFFFEYYQVAPYSSGEFQILIPYEQIKNG